MVFCPEEGEVIVRIAKEDQARFIQLASGSFPPRPGQLLGAQKPWALSEIKTLELYLYPFLKKGSQTVGKLTEDFDEFIYSLTHL